MLRARDSQAMSTPHPLPTQPLTSPLAWGGATWGMCRLQTSPQQSPSHPTAIMRLSALAETEGIVCAGCRLTLKHSRPSERQCCLGQPLWPEAAAPNVTTNSEQAKGQPLSRDRAPLRLQALRPKGPREEIGSRSFGANWIIRS